MDLIKETYGELFLKEHKGIIHLFENEGNLFIVLGKDFNLQTSNLNNDNCYILLNGILCKFCGGSSIPFGEGFVSLAEFNLSIEEKSLLMDIGAKPSISYYNPSNITEEIIVNKLRYSIRAGFEFDLFQNSHSETFDDDIELCKLGNAVLKYDHEEQRYFVKH